LQVGTQAQAHQFPGRECTEGGRSNVRGTLAVHFVVLTSSDLQDNAQRPQRMG
jgi:hypothetical protein